MIKKNSDETNAFLNVITGIIKDGAYKNIIIAVTVYHSRLDEGRIESTFFVVIEDDHKPIPDLEEFIDNYFLDRCMVALDIVRFTVN